MYKKLGHLLKLLSRPLRKIQWSTSFPARAKDTTQNELVETGAAAAVFDVTNRTEAGRYRAANYGHWGVSPYPFQKLGGKDIAHSLKAVTQTARPKLVQKFIEAGPAVHM